MGVQNKQVLKLALLNLIGILRRSRSLMCTRVGERSKFWKYFLYALYG